MSKKPFAHYSRRDFIKDFGTAAGLAVPFLRSSVAMGQTTTAPTRLLVVPLQHGWGVEKRFGGFSGNEFNTFTLPGPMDAFQAIRNQCVFVDGVRSTWWGNAHDVSYSDIMTCSMHFTGEYDSIPNNPTLGGPFGVPRGPSMDWLIGNTLGKNVLRLSAGYQSFGAAFHPMSWDNSQRNLAYFTNAREAWNAIIDPLRIQQQQGGGAPNAGENARNQGLLDVLGRDANRLLGRLSGAERQKMDSYLSSLAALRTRILNSSAPQDLASIVLPGQPAVNPVFNATIDSYLEMIRVAFTLDTHRVAVLGLGNHQPDWSWRDINNAPQNGNIFGNDFHQDVAHYVKGGGVFSQNHHLSMNGWVRWYAGKISQLVNTLSAITDVDGRPMIENTLIVLCGEIGNGDHDRYDMTYVLIGGGGQGRIRRNRWISTPKFNARNRNGLLWATQDVSGNQVVATNNYSEGISVRHASDLWVAIGRLCGLNINSFGFSQYNTTPFVLT